MKLNIAKDQLLNALSAVSKGMSSRSTLPILSGILFYARDDGMLELQATDLEISIRHAVAADIVEQGRAVVPGKLFSDIVKSLPDAAVTVEGGTDRTKVSCMDSSFSLASLNPADFPYFPEIAQDTSVVLPTAQLAASVKKVGRAVSRDEARAILTGVLFSVGDGRVRLVATDSYRLALDDIALEDYEGEPFQAIVPGKIFEDVTRLAQGQDTVTMGFSENQIVFQFGTTVFVSRKIEGNYPNYRQLIPQSHAVTVRADAQALATSVKRVALLAQAHTPIRFNFSEDEQTAVVSARTQDVGTASDSVAVAVEGGDMEIAFNHQYILDGLSSVAGEVTLELQSPLKPAILKAADDEGFLYLAMPVRLS